MSLLNLIYLAQMTDDETKNVMGFHTEVKCYYCERFRPLSLGSQTHQNS